MATIVTSIEVDVPVPAAYNQWTQFESFPEFMDGVEKVVQLDQTRLRWTAKLGGRQMDWDARITEQIPDVRVAWTSTEGPRNGGAVDFHRLDDRQTLIVLVMETEPEGLVESLGDHLGLVRRRVENDLERFKGFIESRGSETGAWRGEVPAPHHRG
jgi:uncharacterized membrane protein